MYDKKIIDLFEAKAEVIDKAEDRLKFRDCMDELGLESPKSQLVGSWDEAKDCIEDIGLPAIIRPSFTLAGTGGGIAYNIDEFEHIVREGLDASPVNEVLVEKGVAWVAVFPPNVRHIKALFSAQERAAEAGAGMWK